MLVLEPRPSREELLRMLDYPPGVLPGDRIQALIGLVEIEAGQLIEGRGAWRVVDPERCVDFGLEPVEAEHLALGLVTLGPGVDEHVQRLQGEGASTSALLVDAYGSAAAEQAADLLSAWILEQLGLAAGDAVVGTPGCRMSPGFPGWGLEHQPALLEALLAQALNVSLTPGMMMVPRKSISFAMWIGAPRPPAQGLKGCRACGLRRCRYLRD